MLYVGNIRLVLWVIEQSNVKLLTLEVMVDNLAEKVYRSSTKSGLLSIVCVQLGVRKVFIIGEPGCPFFRVSYEVRTFRIVYYTVGACCWRVSVKRSCTVLPKQDLSSWICVIVDEASTTAWYANYFTKQENLLTVYIGLVVLLNLVSKQHRLFGASSYWKGKQSQMLHNVDFKDKK